jgi:hypothetical protein
VVGCGWVWLGVVGCGWVWLGVVGCGWVWLGVVGCGWVWLYIAKNLIHIMISGYNASIEFSMCIVF